MNLPRVVHVIFVHNNEVLMERSERAPSCLTAFASFGVFYWKFGQFSRTVHQLAEKQLGECVWLDVDVFDKIPAYHIKICGQDHYVWIYVLADSQRALLTDKNLSAWHGRAGAAGGANFLWVPLGDLQQSIHQNTTESKFVFQSEKSGKSNPQGWVLNSLQQRVLTNHPLFASTNTISLESPVVAGQNAFETSVDVDPPKQIKPRWHF